MGKWYVKVPEIWIQTVEVEADSYEDAVRKVMGGDGAYLDDQLEYSHTVEDSNWFDAEEAEDG